MGRRGSTRYGSKRIVIADLDGTLAEGKSAIDEEMAGLIGRLLKRKDFAVIGRSQYKQFHEQVISRLQYVQEDLSHLYVFPANATMFYRFANSAWKQVYAEYLTREEKDRVYGAFRLTLKRAGFEKPRIVYGEIMEDRGTQITFSALGQKAPPELKRGWDPDASRRKRIKAALEERLPDFEISIGGTTSIDVSRKGIDKAYGIGKIQEYLMHPVKDMLYIGDALSDDGNGFPVKRAGVDTIHVGSVSETKRILEDILEGADRP